MNKIFVVVIFLIVLNLGMTWFNSMGFFSTINISGGNTKNASSLFSLSTGSGWILTGFLSVGLAFIGWLASQFLKINAFGIVAFTIFFWVPYANTVSIIDSFLMAPGNIPTTFLTIFTIFTTVMACLYIYTMIEWSRIPGGI